MSKIIKDEDKPFVTALIEEVIDGLSELKEALQTDDDVKFTSAVVKVAKLKEAASKWMNE